MSDGVRLTNDRETKIIVYLSVVVTTTAISFILSYLMLRVHMLPDEIYNYPAFDKVFSALTMLGIFVFGLLASSFGALIYTYSSPEVKPKK